MVRAAPSGLRDSPWIKGQWHLISLGRKHTVIPASFVTQLQSYFFHDLRHTDGSAILFWLSRDPYDPWPKISMRQKLCGIKRCFDKITSVCDKLSISNYYSKHNICSYEFLLRIHDSFAGQLRNQIRTRGRGKLMKSSGICHFLKKYFWWLLRRVKNLNVNTTSAMSSTDIFISNWFGVC